MMNKDKVIELLKTVSYPGFSRDIVSFGMVQDVKIEDDSISVILQIKTQNDDKRENVINKVNELLKNTNVFQKISVSIKKDSDQQPQSPQSSEGQPPQPLGGVKHVLAVASGKGGVGKSTVA
ncbi:MAG: iron-sulfur cluster assembly protein, partial [SAR202 cluster bacterium]|nr:iron-sulfur cluster assembly protein [SAR202 cluster bacterium]